MVAEKKDSFGISIKFLTKLCIPIFDFFFSVFFWTKNK